MSRKMIYVENDGSPYFKSGSEDIYQALGERCECLFDVKFHIPREGFNIKEIQLWQR